MKIQKNKTSDLENEKDNRILRLKKEIERLKKNIKKQKYGLVWVDVPEAFEDDVENKLPILKEVPKLAIKSNDDKPTHILIEGDNYHALTCLNYTHKGKIDIIYIDPPYNTGSDGFRYKDKRILDKFPDGTEVPKDSPYRHSYWLSFMRKRLELAKDILKESGVIFISIDDNEFAQLKLLCDEIFSFVGQSGGGRDNFIGNIIRNTNSSKNQSNFLSITYDYTLVYAKNISFLNDLLIKSDTKWEITKNNINEYKKQVKILQKKGLANGEITEELKELTKYPRFIDFVNYWYVDKRGVYRKDNLGGVVDGNMKALYNPLTKKNDLIPPGGFRYNENKLKELVKEDRIHFHTDGSLPTLKRYLDENPKQRPKGIMSDDQRPDYNLLKSMGLEFDNPKQLAFMKRIFSIFDKNSMILDFFAGSGTTGQATMELNNDDKGNRQFILVTDNENDIMSKVCYPRIKNVVKGWKDKIKEKSYEGIGNSIKYYKTAFVGKNNILNANDRDKIELAHNAGELLAIAENTLDLVKENKWFQIFENKNQYMAVYFQEEMDKFDDFIEEVLKLKKPVSVYIFSWENEEEVAEFEDMDHIKIKTIPQPILEIYKQIYNLI